jgi:hypothetical protein
MPRCVNFYVGAVIQFEYRSRQCRDGGLGGARGFATGLEGFALPTGLDYLN